MNFEDYLISKKIDSKLFLEKEKELWLSWKTAFEQMHPNSFTAQKLYLINPIRRKYQLKEIPAPKMEEQRKPEGEASSSPSPTEKPAVKIAKPVFKPKPKI
ncbi:MAG TPA: hypothetical protein VFW11_17245 [Cyclobacteriaceae bacterium]|nr:hypothetical protein [Cyclobacteriaceae bacterium]